jgi:uncharacterized integral membrane protein
MQKLKNLILHVFIANMLLGIFYLININDFEYLYVGRMQTRLPLAIVIVGLVKIEVQ